MKTKNIVPIIVLAQFFCSSSWFAVNAIIEDLIKEIGVATSFIADATIAVQFGFIIGTLSFAIFSIADRFSPSKVFFVSSLFVCLFNMMLSVQNIGVTAILCTRFFCGFFLAGIYPVGMKIAADHREKNLGLSLGYLVGALVLGTSFPHLLKGLAWGFQWQYVIYCTSTITFIGGLAVFILVPDGPFKHAAHKIAFRKIFDGFKNADFKAAALGYFGHMWELYSFWAFVPLMLQTYAHLHGIQNFNISLLSFLIIASGSIACILSGMLSSYFGAKKMALWSLSFSGLCCLLSPVFFMIGSSYIFVAFLIFWGMVVIADSPVFSSLVAQYAPLGSKGTSLTFVNCIGFSITILSIQIIKYTIEAFNYFGYILLALGPILGLLWAYYSKKQQETKQNKISEVLLQEEKE